MLVKVGIWSLEVGIWSLEVGILSLEVGILSLEVGILSQEVGILSLDQPATAGFFAKVGLTASSPRETHCCILGLKGNA